MAPLQVTPGISRRQFLRRTALAGGAVMLAGPISSLIAACGGGEDKLTGPIRMLAWSDKDHPDVKARFKDDTGVDVISTDFNDNEEAFGKIKVAGTDAYDTIFMDGLWCLEYHRNGFVEPFDFTTFNSYSEFFPKFANYAPWQVDGGMLAVPHAWSPYGILYNKEKVSMPDPPSFEVFFDPKYEGKVALRDNFNRNFLMTASLQGFEDYEVDTPGGSRWDLPDDILERAKTTLIERKSNFKLLWRSGGALTRALATEEVWLAFGNNINALQAVDAGNNNIEFAVPKERTIGWVDGAMLVANAKNKESTVKWLDHWASAESQFTIQQEQWLAVTNKAALDMLSNHSADFKDRLEKLKAYQAEEWADTFSLFRPVNNPSRFQDAWAEFLAS